MGWDDGDGDGDSERSQGKKRSVDCVSTVEEDAQMPEGVGWMEEMFGMVARIERERDGGVVVTLRMESEDSDADDERMAM